VGEDKGLGGAVVIRAHTVTILTILLLAAPAALQSAEFYVAPHGVDTNPGTLEQPLRTIQKAASLAGPGDTVFVRAGTYRETVSPLRSGEAGRPIVFRNYEQETAVVSGTEVVPANAWSTDGAPVYQTAVPMPLGTDNQLFLDGRMMLEARFPNTSLDVSRPVKLAATSGPSRSIWLLSWSVMIVAANSVKPRTTMCDLPRRSKAKCRALNSTTWVPGCVSSGGRKRSVWVA